MHTHTHLHTLARTFAVCTPRHSVSDMNLILRQSKCTRLSYWDHSRLEMTSITDLPKPKTLATASYTHTHTHTYTHTHKHTIRSAFPSVTSVESVLSEPLSWSCRPDKHNQFDLICFALKWIVMASWVQWIVNDSDGDGDCGSGCSRSSTAIKLMSEVAAALNTGTCIDCE